MSYMSVSNMNYFNWLVKINLCFKVSGNPPLFDIIVAQPAAPDSIATLPKGSSHLDGITHIEDFFILFIVGLN